MRFPLLLALVLLAGCGRHAATEPGGISAEDSAMLNNAAAMLDTEPDQVAAPENDAEANVASSDVASSDNAD